MKITKEEIKAVIKEELEKLDLKEEWPSAEFTPEQQAVLDKIGELIDALEVMANSQAEPNISMGDYYVHLFKALKKDARANIEWIAKAAA